MTWSDPAYEGIANLVNLRTGLKFLPSRHDSAELGMRQAMARAGISDASRYHALLLGSPAAFDDLVCELAVGETYFFREPAQFEFIRHEVLPEFRRRRPEATIRVWSAACASGEEAYSLAILLEEEGLAAQAQILATDISHRSLARARQGTYTTWSLRGEGAAHVEPYLIRRGVRLALADRIRNQVSFAQLNLAGDDYPSAVTNTWRMDLILCRNVLIYFDPTTVRKTARRLFESLAPGGWLVTGSADPPLPVNPPMEVVVTSRGVFYRRSLDGVGIKTEETPLPKEKSAPSTVYRVPSTQYSVPSTQYSVPSTLYSVPCPPPLPPTTDDPLTLARAALARGDYARAADLTGHLCHDIATAVLHVRALANVDSALAEQACATIIERQPLSTELHYLHALLLVNLGRDREAILALRRVLYLDRSLGRAHFTLGSLLKQQGDRAGARRAFRNARDLCLALPAEEILALSEGEQAGRLAEAAAFQLAHLDATQEKTS